MTDFYTQCPNVLIFGLPDLSSNDKMTLLCLVSLAWGNEGPHQLSIRELSRFVHISPATLCDSAKEEADVRKQKEQGKFREGILSRLAKPGYITLEEIGGKTYFTVHLARIWEENAAFKKQVGVYNLNTINKNRQNGVYNLNAPVYNLNTQPQPPVYNLNTPVYNLNGHQEPDGSTSQVSTPIKTKKTFIEEEEESTSILRKPSGFVTGIMQRVSRTLHDWHHLEENIAEGQEIFDAAQVDLATFKMRVDTAMKQASIAKLEQLRNYGFQDKMHYFFYCLLESLHLR